MAIRKSHENNAVKKLYEDVLRKPLSELSHKWLHTHYTARPRKPPITLSAPSTPVDIETGDSGNTVYVVYGTQSGTAAQAAKEIKIELQQFIARAKLSPVPDVCVFAGNALKPEKLMEYVADSLGTIFVTSTFGEGEMPEMMQQVWEYVEGCKDGKFESFRYGEFLICSFVAILF